MRTFLAFWKFALVMALAQATVASGADLRVFSASSMRQGLEELAPQFERVSGHRLTIEYDSSSGLKRKIDRGEAFDVGILTLLVSDDAIKSGRLIPATRTAIGQSGMGIAARAGAPRPVMDSQESLKRGLLGAKSIAYSAGGVTGAHLLRMVERLGVSAEMKRKLKPYRNGDVALLAVANGEAELAFSDMTTILAASGVQLVGPLPPGVQEYVVYVAVLSSTSKEAAAGKSLISFLTGERARALFKAKGLEPAVPR